jgi:hypothetical protein
MGANSSQDSGEVSFARGPRGYPNPMWLYLIAIVLLVFGLVGGVLTGGIFLIIFIPLGLIALATAVGTGLTARSAHKRAGASDQGSPRAGQPLPHTLATPSGHVPSSPDALVDERMRQQ